MEKKSENETKEVERSGEKYRREWLIDERKATGKNVYKFNEFGVTD